jgi:hypothetical protein
VRPIPGVTSFRLACLRGIAGGADAGEEFGGRFVARVLRDQLAAERFREDRLVQLRQGGFRLGYLGCGSLRRILCISNYAQDFILFIDWCERDRR